MGCCNVFGGRARTQIVDPRSVSSKPREKNDQSGSPVLLPDLDKEEKKFAEPRPETDAVPEDCKTSKSAAPSLPLPPRPEVKSPAKPQRLPPLPAAVSAKAKAQAQKSLSTCGSLVAANVPAPTPIKLVAVSHPKSKLSPRILVLVIEQILTLFGMDLRPDGKNSFDASPLDTDETVEINVSSTLRLRPEQFGISRADFHCEREGWMVVYGRGASVPTELPGKIAVDISHWATTKLREKHENAVARWNSGMMNLLGERKRTIRSLAHIAGAFDDNDMAIVDGLHKAEMELFMIAKGFERMARAYVRQIGRNKEPACTTNWLFGIPYPFYYFSNVLIFSADSASSSQASTPAQRGKRLKNLCRSMNMARKRVAGSTTLAGKVTVPVCSYIRYSGVAYLAIGIEPFSPGAIVFATFPGAGRFAAKDAVATEIVAEVCKSGAIRPESILLLRQKEGKYTMLLTECSVPQVRPWIWARRELRRQEGKRLRHCSECSAAIGESTTHYSGTRSAGKEYYCCQSCYEELDSAGMLSVPKRELKKISQSKTGDKASTAVSVQAMTENSLWETALREATESLVWHINEGEVSLVSPSEVAPLFHSYGVNIFFLGEVFAKVSTRA